MLKKFDTVEAMEAYISSQIHGAFSTMDMQVLGDYVKRLEPGDQYLEVGTDYGKSAASAVFQAKDGIRFYFCDINDPEPDPNFPTLLSRKNFFEQEGLNEVGQFFHMDNKEFAKTWDKGELAMIFIDGNHEYEEVRADILSWIPFLKSGGYILFHDYDITSFGVQKAVDELIRDSDQFENFFYAQTKYQLKSSIAGARKK